MFRLSEDISKATPSLPSPASSSTISAGVYLDALREIARLSGIARFLSGRLGGRGSYRAPLQKATLLHMKAIVPNPAFLRCVCGRAFQNVAET